MRSVLRLAWLIVALLWVSASHASSLKFWAVGSSISDVKMYNRLAADFTRKTGIQIEVTTLAWGNFATKYFASMAAGLPPDIGVTNLGGPFDYGTVGGLVDLREEFPQEAKQLEARFNPHLLDMFTLGDKLFGIPSDLSTNVLYYRTDVFNRLGLKPPTTWSEMDALIRRLEAEGYRYYFGFPAGAQWAMNMFTLPFGKPGFALDPAGKPYLNWNDPAYQAGVLECLELLWTHDSPGKDLGNKVVGMFRSNDKSVAVPFFIDLHTVSGQIRITAPEIEGKWDIAPWPKADQGAPSNVMGGTAYVIFRKSTKKKEAMQWLMYLNSLEIQDRIIFDRENRGEESAISLSPLKDVWGPENHKFWQDSSLIKDQRIREVITHAFPAFRTVPTIHGSVEASRLESNLLDQMGSYIRDRMDDLGTKYKITRSELVRRLGNGSLENERAKLHEQIAARLKAEYAKIAPEGTRLLEHETAHYQERYGDIVARLPEYERQRNVLDVVKLVVGLMLLAAFGAIASLKRLRKHFVSYVFVAIPIVLALIFVFVPAVTALYLSFTDYHPVLPLSTAQWVGVDNYKEALGSGDLLATIGRTIKYSAYTLPIGIVLALVFAYLLNSKLRGERIWRFLYFSPLVTSVVSIALIFTQLFLGGKQGWLNALLLGIGAIKDPIPFLTSEHTFLNCVIILAIWHGLAFTVLVFLAGLQQIPEALFEAATMDGANPVRRFWNIAVPGLRPQLFFITVLGVIGAFQVFETIYVLAGKSGDAGARFGPNDSALTMVPLIYHTGFETFEMGKSAAYAYILFIIILTLSAVQFGVYRRKEGRE